jgi:hypothetical protein
MSRWSEERWVELPDGSFRRRLQSDLPEYAGMTKPQLAKELELRGLPKTGTKDELIARLEEAGRE